jgi:hypothetical protein
MDRADILELMSVTVEMRTFTGFRQCQARITFSGMLRNGKSHMSRHRVQLPPSVRRHWM